jgi:transcriptional regulator with XRE-family HTH domain
VKKRRLELGLSKKAVADKVDVSAAHIGQLESGEKKNPSKIVLGKLADTLNVNLVWLRDGIGSTERRRGLLESPGSAIVRETSVDAPNITDTGAQPYVGEIDEREAWVILSYRRLSEQGKEDVDDVIAGCGVKKSPVEGGATGAMALRGREDRPLACGIGCKAAELAHKEVSRIAKPLPTRVLVARQLKLNIYLLRVFGG